MKLTQRAQCELEHILRDVNRGLAFVMRPDVHLCRETTSTNTEVFLRQKDRQAIYSMTKEVGNEFCIALAAAHRLQQWIDHHSLAQKNTQNEPD